MSTVTIGVTPVRVVNRNPKRMSVSFRNSSPAGQIIYLDNVDAGGLSTANAGYVLNVGQSLNFVLSFDGREIQQPFSAIASAAGGLMHYKEMADIKEVE